MQFDESFMRFCFPDDDAFRIEDDELVTAARGTKACECIVALNHSVALIEAKASAPSPMNAQRLNDFLADIVQKFDDSLRLFLDIRAMRMGEAAFLRLPLNLRHAPLSPAAYKIYLIIHGHKEEWLIGLLDTFREAMRGVVERYMLRDTNLKVLNEQGALDNNIIIAFIPSSESKQMREANGNADQAKVRQWFETH